MIKKSTRRKTPAKAANRSALVLGARDAFDLVKACYAGDVAAVKRRLREGVDPDTLVERNGNRLLSAACKEGQRAVAKVLLDAGADPNAKDSWKAMPPHGTPLENA